MLFTHYLFLWYNLTVMMIKKISLSLLILASLVFSSFAFFAVAQNNSATGNNIFLDSDQDGLTDEEEKSYGTEIRNKDTDGDGYSDGAEVKSGYDPRKPAPGDKILVTESLGGPSQNEEKAVLGETIQNSNENLTQKIAQKLSELTTKVNPDDQSLSLEQVQGLIDDSLSSETSDIQIPEIKKDDLKIKIQNYGSLGDEKAKERRKEDFLNYTTAVFYILSSNSPKPLTSSANFTSILSEMTQEITGAFTSGDTSNLGDLNKSGEKITQQLKEVEVPEEMADSHIKVLEFSYYAQNLEKYIKPNSSDPMGDIANLSKIEGFISALASFSDDIGKKFDEYEIKYDSVLQGKLKEYGIEPATEDDALLKELSE